MPTLAERLSNIWQWMQGSPAVLPTRLEIPAERLDRGSRLGDPFKPDAHYFQVRVNEMFLTDRRQWFTTIEPMVFFASEFIYGSQTQTVPFIVGPELVSKAGVKTPEGLVINNTRVAGLHPYRGGPLTLSVVLFSVPKKNYARELLGLIEQAAGAIDFANALGSYLSIASVILDGIEALLGLGETTPIAGLRTTFDPDAQDMLRPGYFVLIAPTDTAFDPNQLWVRDNQLVNGVRLDAAVPFRMADYVLYSIAQTAARSDERTLPFYPLFEQVKAAATRPDEDSWKVAKANMIALNQALVNSNDLTPAQADVLFASYLADMKKQRERAVDLGSLSAEKEPTAAEKKVLTAASSILDLP